MLLETLLLSPCFLSGKTSHTDSKTTLSVNRNELKGDEILLFFHIDDQSNPDCKVREQFWQQQDGHSLCDLLVFYAKGDERIFCFVELKDNKKDLPKATEQVLSTYQAFKAKLAVQFSSKYTAKAFICCSTGDLPQERQRYQDKLNKMFGEHYKADGKSTEFLKFLRGEASGFKKSGKANNKK